MPERSHSRRDLLLLAALLALLFGLNLGGRALWSPVEGRYAEIAREMVTSGDYATPRLNGVKYFEKPPLFYWLEAFSIRLFGPREWAVRLWPALFAILGCIAVYGAGLQLYGRRAGIAAAVVLATSPLYYALGRIVAVDMALAFFLACSLLTFLVAAGTTSGVERPRFMWGFYAFAALATLTKGLIGALIPALVVGAWIAFAGQWKIIRAMHLPSGILIYAAIAVPWHVIVALRNPGFAQFYFIHEHFGRYLRAGEGGMGQAWAYIPALVVGLFPWIAFLPQALKSALPSSWRRRAAHREDLYLCVWAVVIFLFFSGATSRLFTYILPLFPPLALLIGRSFEAWCDGSDEPPLARGVWIAAAAMLLLALAAVAGLPHALERFSNWPSLEMPSDDATIPGAGFARFPDLSALGPYIYAQAAILVAGAAVMLVLQRRGRRRAIFFALAATSALFLSVVDATLPLLDQRRSVKDLALALRAELGPADEVATYRTYYQDLPFYLERRLSVVAWRGELDYGARVEDTRAWMIDEAEFWRRWSGQEKMYAVTDRENYERMRSRAQPRVHLVAGNDYNVVLTNRLAGITGATRR